MVTGCGASRPLPHTREGRDEKVRYGGLGGASRPPPHTREGREREGEVADGGRPDPPPHTREAESEKVRWE
jgi:hypothetical protein